MMEYSELAIDWHQVKTLLIAAFKTDMRGSNNPMNMARNKHAKLPPITGVFILMGLIGIGLAVSSCIIKDPFMSANIVFTFMMLFLSITILLEFSNLILSPDEHRIVTPLPIGSKTFFVTKLIHLLVYVNTLAAVVYLPSSGAIWITGHNVLFFFSFSLAGMLAATTVGMAFVVLYTLLLRILNPEKMQQIAGYAQLILITMFYFLYFIVPRLFFKGSLGFLQKADSNWIYLAPPAWFGAIAELPAGITAIGLFASFTGIVMLLIFFRAGVSRLSLDYAQTLSSTVGQQDQIKRGKKKGIFAGLFFALASHEDRAVWKLIRKQFKYDNRFKMSILAIIPLTAFYVYMGIDDGKSMADPFAISFSNQSGRPNFLLYMAVAMLPFIITVNTSFSASYHSAWVFFTSPADRTRIVLSSSRFALYYFCFPFTVLLVFLFTWFFGNMVHALLHSVFIFVILMILTKFMVLLYPRVPFSQQNQKGSSTIIFLMMFIAMPLVIIPMSIVSMIGYGGYNGYAMYIAVSLIINFMLYVILKWKIPGKVAKLEISAQV